MADGGNLRSHSGESRNSSGRRSAVIRVIAVKGISRRGAFMGRVFVDGARYVRLRKGALDEFDVRLNLARCRSIPVGG